MKKHQKIFINMVHRTVHVYVNMDLRQLNQAVLKLGYGCSLENEEEESDEENWILRGSAYPVEETKYSNGEKEYRIWIIWLQVFNPLDPVDIGTLCHEASHTALNILRYLDFPLPTKESVEEPYAYLTECIVRETLQGFLPK